MGKKCNSEISLNQRIYSYSTTCADGYKYKEEFNIADRINLLDRAKIVFHELANMGALSSCDNLPDHVFNVIEVNDKAKLFNAEFDTVMADFPKQHDYNLCATEYCRNYREALRSLFQSVKIKSVFYKEEKSSLKAKNSGGPFIGNFVSLEFTGFHLTKRVTPAYDRYAPPLVEYFYPEHYVIYDTDWPSIKLFLTKIGAHFDTIDDQTSMVRE